MNLVQGHYFEVIGILLVTISVALHVWPVRKFWRDVSKSVGIVAQTAVLSLNSMTSMSSKPRLSSIIDITLLGYYVT